MGSWLHPVDKVKFLVRVLDRKLSIRTLLKRGWGMHCSISIVVKELLGSGGVDNLNYCVQSLHLVSSSSRTYLWMNRSSKGRLKKFVFFREPSDCQTIVVYFSSRSDSQQGNSLSEVQRLSGRLSAFTLISEPLYKPWARWKWVKSFWPKAGRMESFELLALSKIHIAAIIGILIEHSPIAAYAVRLART